MNIRINENCTEFGRTFTVGQVVSDLTGMERLALVLSGFASWIGANDKLGAHPAIAALSDVNLLTPITSRQFSNPWLYNVAGLYGRRATLDVGERRYQHNGQTYRLVEGTAFVLA